jgi:hypothetical protein
MRLQVRLKKIVQKRLCLKVEIMKFLVFLLPEILQDKSFPGLPGTLEKKGFAVSGGFP